MMLFMYGGLGCREAQRQRRPSGSLAGHLEGITHISSRGDGRYFISNSKDQSIKLWDIRMLCDQRSDPTTVPERYLSTNDRRATTHSAYT